MVATEAGGKPYVRAPSELVDHLHPVEAKSAFKEQTRITSERDGVAGDGRDPGDGRGREFMGLSLSPGTRRVDDCGVEAGHLVRPQRAAEEIARLRGDALEFRGLPPAPVERGQHGRAALHGMDPGILSKGKAEGATARKEIHNAGRT